mmetsp:Transcript_670/g.1491  ORF Transcript_670/g.1491 Transcript_670/m.1491 type:complete len:202 (-) Transcript_670:256-861(-)
MWCCSRNCGPCARSSSPLQPGRTPRSHAVAPATRVLQRLHRGRRRRQAPHHLDRFPEDGIVLREHLAIARRLVAVPGTVGLQPPGPRPLAFAIDPGHRVRDIGEAHRLHRHGLHDGHRFAAPIQQHRQGADEGDAAIRVVPVGRRRGRLDPAEDQGGPLVRQFGMATDGDRQVVAGLLPREGRFQDVVMKVHGVGEAYRQR